ncbi:hypothetical protein H5410_046879 [Solanum commersonii]|uniref:Uncharacterized protein n=1 Tax=Solanum commersonii TaxID=4109 RepID=A0A9J5XFI4_SOLCO|nr:hypothetical protein H5410_046879 [Solanum commersonii]
MGFPLSYHVGVFEFRGPTAYCEFVEVCKSKLGEKVFVSAASDSIRHLARQYAKLHGCYVVAMLVVEKRMLAAAVANMNSFGRVAVCGIISEYTNASTRAAPEILSHECDAEFFPKTVEYLLGGKLKTIEDVSRGVESIPSAFIGLFNGENIGKKIVKVADE